jgi:hypothetical protein
VNKPISTAAVFLFLLGFAAAADLPDQPPMKEGLWKIHMVTTSAGQPPTDSTFSLCRNHAYDDSVHAIMQKSMAKCTTVSSVKLLGKLTMTVSCKVGGSTLTTRSVVSSSGENSYHSESQTTYDPPLYGQSQSTMVQDQTFAGACPAGMNPGDRMLANGQIQHHGQMPPPH